MDFGSALAEFSGRGTLEMLLMDRELIIGWLICLRRVIRGSELNMH